MNHQAFAQASAVRGFSSLELICSLSLFILLIGFGASNYPELKRSFDQNAAYSQVRYDLQRAKTEALRSGARVIFSESAGGGYSVGVDYLPFSIDDTVDEVLFARDLPDGYSVDLSNKIIFDSRGAIIDEWGYYGFESVSLFNDLGAQFVWGSVYGAGQIDMYGYRDDY